MKLVSFYFDVDSNDFYYNASLKLKKQCDILKQPYIIVERKFGNSWIDNVRAKPLFLLEMLNHLDQDFVWLDIDSKIHKKVDFQINTQWMLSINRFSDNDPYDYVHVLKNTQNTKDFLNNWVSKIEEIGKGSHTAFNQIYQQLSYTEIPKGYFSNGVSIGESKNNYFNR